MINFEALYKISYGIYIVSSGTKEKGNGYISNTVFQVTSKPPKIATCCSKNNYTVDFIINTNFFSVSVIKQDADPGIFSPFGYKSGRDIDKLKGMQVKYGSAGTPIVFNEAIAWFECKVERTIDLGTHLMFIGELVQSEVIDGSKEPLTYLHYRNVFKGLSPKNAPTYIEKSNLTTKTMTGKSGKFRCVLCGYIYDENIEKVKFKDLPDDWVCPECGAGKEDFVEE